VLFFFCNDVVDVAVVVAF